MEKEAITILAQLLSGMKDALEKLEEAQKDKDVEKFNLAKREIMNFHEQIAKLT